MVFKKINLNDLKKQLYLKYSPVYLAKELSVSKNHFFKLINGKANMTVMQYNILITVLEDN